MSKEENGIGAIPAPPKGFTLDSEIPPPPPGFTLDTSPAAPQAPKKAGGFTGIASEVGKMLYDAPTQVAGAFGQLLEGSTPYAEKDWKDDVVSAAKQRTQERLAEPGADTPLPFGFTGKDFRNTGASLGFTGISAGAGLAAGIPASMTPAGPTGGYAVGGLASGAAAHQMAANSLVRSIIEAEDEDAIEKTGAGLTQEQKQAREAEIQSQANEYGLWEAIPEAVGNVAGLKVLATPLKKMLGKNVVTKVMSKLGGLYGTEMATETVTQMGQNNVEAEFDAERERRAFDDPAAWYESMAEVAPQVFILTTLMGGAGAVGMKAYEKGVTEPKQAQAFKDAAADRDQLRVIPNAQLDPLIEKAEALSGKRKRDGGLGKAVETLKMERERRQIMGFPDAGGIDVAVEQPEDVTVYPTAPEPPAAAAPFPEAGGIAVDEIPTDDMGDVTLQSPSPLQEMAGRLKERVRGIRSVAAFGEAEGDQQAKKDTEIGKMAVQAMRERDMPTLQALAERVRQKRPDQLGEVARRQKIKDEAAQDQQAAPDIAGIEVDEDAFAPPANSAMADALRTAGAAPADAGQSNDRQISESAATPDEIRPKSGNPYKTEASARNIVKIRKLKGYEPVEADGGWVLRRGEPAIVPDRKSERDASGDSPTKPTPAPAVVPQDGKHPYEKDLENTVAAWGRHHTDDYKASPTYQEQKDAFKQGFEDRAAGRGRNVPGGMSRLAERDYDLGFGAGREAGQYYDDWASTRTKKKGGTKQAAPTTEVQQDQDGEPFVPTHELPDGTPVRALNDEEDVFWDANGDEYIEPNAKEIKNAEQEQAAETPAAAPAEQKDGVADTKGTRNPQGKRVTSEPAATPEADKLDIFKKTRGAYLKGMIQREQLKKGSPGYASAVARLEDQYETELDKAYAGLPFSEFNALNPDSSEEMNRQAHAALQEEHGIEAAPETTGTTGTTGTKDGTSIGKNTNGDEVFEDADGHRYVMVGDGTFRSYQKVRMIPTRAGVKQEPVPDERYEVVNEDQGDEFVESVGEYLDGMLTNNAGTTRSSDSAGTFITQAEADKQLEEWRAFAESEGKTSKNAGKTVLSLFDESGVWSAPWVLAGYNVIQVDIQNGVDINEFSIDYFADNDINDADVILAACPCTHFAGSGARWWKMKDESGKTEQNIELVRQTFRTIEYLRPRVWAIENPVGRIEKLTGLPKPTLVFQPHHYGDPYTKKTMLYGNFDADLPQSNVKPTEGSKIHKLRGDNPEQKKQRSVTPEGFAYAFFMANHAGAAAQKDIDAAANEAATSPTNDLPEPTDGQKEAGNYKVGRITINGLDISVENPKGSMRTGTDKDGETWSQEMKDHYGYIRGTVGIDKDHIDVFLGTLAQDMTLPVFIIDQVDPKTGLMDEHKVMLGYRTGAEAKIAYLRNYQKGWKGLGAITRMSKDGFNEWVFNATRTSRPVANKIKIRNERRKNDALRKRIADMSPEEMRKELLTDTLTGLGNRRAYDDDIAANPGQQHAYMDVDALKWVNDNMGHPNGDELLKAMGAALKQATSEFGGSRAYRMSGDEFVVLTDNADLAKRIADRAQLIGQSADLEYTAPDGTKTTKTGVEFSYGIGQDLKTADEALKRDKADREERGLRAPRGGVPSGVATTPAEERETEVQGSPVKVTQAGVVDQTPEEKLLVARNQLIVFRTMLENQGRVADARLGDKVRQQEQLVKDLEKEVNDAAPVEAAPDTAASPPPPADKTKRPSDYGTTNTVFTEDAAEKARALLKAKLGQLSAGLDPEIVQAGITLAGYHIEAGARKFGDFAKAMIEDLGDSVQPYLRGWYEAVRYYPGIDAEGMTQPGEMDAAILNVTVAGDESGRQDVQEADSQAEPGIRKDGGGTGVGTGNGNDGGMAQDQAANGGSIGEAGDSGAVRPRHGDQEGTGGAGERGGRDGVAGLPGAGGAGLDNDGAGRPGNPRGTDGDQVEILSHRAENYHIEDPGLLVSGTPKKRFAKNKRAIEAYQSISDGNREATPEDRDALASYIGWGSFGQELFQGTWEKPVYKEGWNAENDWLRDHLGESEWKSAQASIRNAHYTDPHTINAVWSVVRKLGFKGGRVLEPAMGIGNFFGLMPKGLKNKSQLAGIELDQLSAGISKILYPQANIQQMGYQESNTPDDFYDVVIGNWPFDSVGPADRRYNKLSPSLHDYFFLKALDQVRPGGLVVGITSRYSMDSVSKSIRRELAKKGELVTSFRLPSGAFNDYAGTSVVTDIIILKKRAEPLLNLDDEAWIRSYPVEFGSADRKANINMFYQENPDHVLGKHDFGHGTTYGREGLIVNRPDDYQDRLASISDLVEAGTYEQREKSQNIKYITNNTGDRTNSVTTGKDGGLFVVHGEYLAPLNDVAKYQLKDQKKTAKREDQITRLVGLRREYGALIDAERDGSSKTEGIRKSLKAKYDAFVKTHGPINKSDGIKILAKVRDPFYPALASLEENRDGLWEPMAILSRPVTRQRKKLENPTVRDAYVMQRNESMIVDPAAIADAAGVTENDVVSELIGSGALFRSPDGNYEPSDVYLSGNVRRKLREAKAAKEQGEDMDHNIAELEKVIPTDIPYFNIEAQLGAQWVNPRHYMKFVAEDLLGLPDAAERVSVEWRRTRWVVTVPDDIATTADAMRLREIVAYRDTGAVDEDGNRVMAVADQGVLTIKKIVEAAFNNLTMKFTGRDAEGNSYPRVEYSSAANDRAESVRDRFQEWVWKDPERKISLERDYNEVMNAVAPPVFDGGFLEFEGMALQRGESQFNLRSHQVNAIWRGLVQGGSIYAHEVGTGKTYTMGGIAVESRRFGIAKKPLILAHNANSASVAAEINEMYPGAKVLYVDNLNRERIDIVMRQIANDDWDAVVMPHSLIDRLSLKRETLMAMAADDIAALEDEFFLAAEEDGISVTGIDLNDKDAIKKLRSPTAKDLAKQRLTILANIEKQAQRSSREDAVPFEDLGIDMVMVDEAHLFKKPPMATRMKMRGLQTQTSSRSIALNFLTKYIKRERQGSGVHLFTGTPITNTLTEIYHMQRYVMDGEMARDGVESWDSWFNTFASGLSDVEYTSSGDYKPVTRLSSFVNVAELRRMMSPYMDVVFANDMPEFNPRRTSSGKVLSDELSESERNELLNGRTENPSGRPYKKTIMDVAPPSPAQAEVLEYIKTLSREWDDAQGKQRHEWIIEGDDHSPVRMDTIASQSSLDARLHDRWLEDHEDSKASRVVANVMRHYTDEPDAAQVIFVEKGYNDTKQSHGTTVPGFNLVKEIKARLIESGIPESEIAIVKGGVKAEKKKAIADAVSENKIRVVIGQTETLGTGVNMQGNLRAMHHLDAPWMPGELEQRNGRGWRQGNKWNTVLEYRYLTEKMDGKRWQVLSIKDRFIKNFLRADENLRVIEGDAASDTGGGYAETLSEAIGDPRMLLRQKLKQDVERLQRKERAHTQGLVDAKQALEENKRSIPALRASAKLLDADYESYSQAFEEAGKQQIERNTKATVDYLKSIGLTFSDSELSALADGGWGTKQSDRELANRVSNAVSSAEKAGHERPKPEATVPFQATLNGKAFTKYADFDDALMSVAQRLKHDARDAEHVGDIFGFPIMARKSHIRGEAVIFLQSLSDPDRTYRSFGKSSGQSLTKLLRDTKVEARYSRNSADRLEGDEPKLAAIAEMPFDRQDDLDRKKVRLEQIEEDMALNPVPPPGWLRHGAPVDTEVFFDGRPVIVEGHQWSNDGYFVFVTDGDQSKRIAYLDLNDANGDRLYERHEFVAPDEDIPAVTRDEPQQNLSIVLTQDEKDSLLRDLSDPTSDDQVFAFDLLTAHEGKTLKLDSANAIERLASGISYNLDSEEWVTIAAVSKRLDFIQREVDGQQRLPAFSRQSTPKDAPAPLGFDFVEKTANAIAGKSGLASGVTVNTVRTEQDLPADVLKQAEKEGALGQIVAVHRDRDIFLVADRHLSVAKIEESILHEGTHYGAKQLFGQSQSKAYRKIWFGLKGINGVQDLGKKLGFDMGDYVKSANKLMQEGKITADERMTYLVDEFLAHAQGMRAYETLPDKIKRSVQEFWGAIRAMLKSAGFVELPKYTESDLAFLLRNIHTAAQGQTVSMVGVKQARFLTEQATEDTETRFSRANPFSRAEEAPVSEFHEENRRIREEDKTLWNKAKKGLQRQLAPGGLLPSSVFKLKIERDSQLKVSEIDAKNLVAHLEDAVKAEYGTTFAKLDENRKAMLNKALAGKVAEEIPEPIRLEIVKMRQYIDGLSVEYADMLYQEAAKLLADGNIEGAAARAGLLETIAGNIGTYVNRSYKAFDDRAWPKHVPVEVIDAARQYLRDQYQEKAAQYDEWAAKAIDRGEDAKAAKHIAAAQALRHPEKSERTINTILKEGTAFDSMEAMIRESKLGAKDLSVLIRRKQIAPQIRALLGEYTDPRINFTKSAAKMSRLVFNQKFLEKVQDQGMGEFLFTDDTRPPAAHKKIAATGNEAYAPLSGLYTYPEVEQAFRDVLGKENMADWYRMVVQVNGMVKYGKAQPLTSTIYTPTGPVDMGDLNIGDEVCGANGRTCVTGIFPQGEIDTYRIRFSDGAEVEASGEHLWEINLCGVKAPRIMTTEDILALPDYRFAKRQVSVPVAEADFDKQPVPIDPYTMGALLGDGSFRSPATVRFSSVDDEILVAVANGLPANHFISHPASWAGCDYTIVSKGQKDNQIRLELAKMGLWGKSSKTKFIPDLYKRNSRDVRLQVVRGLLDTDGGVVRDGQPALSVSNERLAKDFADICTSLGMPCLITRKKTSHADSFTVKIKCEDASNLFTLQRKREKCRPRKKPIHRTIVSIEPAGKQACQCIRVEDDRHLYMTDGFVLTHNTVLSPTTAARNWMSAFFFTMANGHFDLTQATKSVSSMREYFTHKGSGLAYLKHLNKLGVVYDTPYAGEMMRLLEESKIEDRLMGDNQATLKGWLDYATKFYQFGDDFWKIIGFENEKALLMKHKGLSLEQAEVQAAERIRNTYPTYSMTGKFVNSLRRFPLAGTFVSFPSEIIRTSYHILRYLKEDMKDPALRPLAMRRIVGFSFASGFAYAAQAIAMSMLGVSDDEEEAFRDLAAPWQRNSNIIPISRDEKGHLRFIDLSFLDPYNYWKRPINAILRDQPYEDIAQEIARETLTPFFGTDIMAGAISEAIANKKQSGGRIFNPADDPMSQTQDILNHIRKAAQPGVASNVERTYKALNGQVSPSGRKYNLGDEAAAFAGFRVSTYDPKASLYYKSFEFQDQKRDATSILTTVARDPNAVSDDQVRGAYLRSLKVREQAYKEMGRLVQAARASGLSNRQIASALRNSGISQVDTFALIRGVTPPWRPSRTILRGAIRKAGVLFDPQTRDEFARRQQLIQGLQK